MDRKGRAPLLKSEPLDLPRPAIERSRRTYVFRRQSNFDQNTKDLFILSSVVEHLKRACDNLLSKTRKNYEVLGVLKCG